MQRVLEDPRATPAQVAQVIGIDAALAARILRLSNSAFLNPSGKPITELQQAVNRLGHQRVRSTAVSFALQQMKVGEGEAVLRPKLHELGRKGTLVASIAHVLGHETKAANPDEALVAGLMHNIGSLYITVRAYQAGGVLATDAAAVQLLNKGHARIAAAILGHWKFAPSIVTAVGNQNSTESHKAGAERLNDVRPRRLRWSPASSTGRSSMRPSPRSARSSASASMPRTASASSRRPPSRSSRCIPRSQAEPATEVPHGRPPQRPAC